MAARKTKAQPKTDERLELRYVEVGTVKAWESNAKKHDFGALWESIKRHGFRDPPSFDARLNGGTGGIVEGNGRSHVLDEMRAANEPAPRGIAVENGVWLMPVLFGLDAESERAAHAYGIAHNNLTLSGGDFGPLEIQRMYDEVPYIAMLADLRLQNELPVSIDEDDVEAAIERMAREGKKIGSDYDSFEQTQSISKSGQGEKPTFGVLVICEGEGEQAEQFQRLKDEGYNCVMQGGKPPGIKR